MVCLSSVCVLVKMEGVELTTWFSFPLISHLLCLDYYFGRRPVPRRCINICSQFALWPRSSLFLLCLDVPLLCNIRPLSHYTLKLVMGHKKLTFGLVSTLTKGET